MALYHSKLIAEVIVVAISVAFMSMGLHAVEMIVVDGGKARDLPHGTMMQRMFIRALLAGALLHLLFEAPLLPPIGKNNGWSSVNQYYCANSAACTRQQ